MGWQELASQFAGWERKLFDFVATQESSEPEFTVKFTDSFDLRIHRLHSSPETSVTEVGCLGNIIKTASILLIGVNDEVYAGYPHRLSIPNPLFHEVFGPPERNESDRLSIKRTMDRSRKKYAGWERRLFDFLASHASADTESESIAKLDNGIELHIRVLYSTPWATVIDVSYDRGGACVMIRIGDDVYASVPIGSKAPDRTFRYVIEILDYRARKRAT